MRYAAPLLKELATMILEKAALKGAVTLVDVVEALFSSQTGVWVSIEIAAYAGMLQRLVLDTSYYRPAAIRLLLNVALSKAR